MLRDTARLLRRRALAIFGRKVASATAGKPRQICRICARVGISKAPMGERPWRHLLGVGCHYSRQTDAFHLAVATAA